MFNGEHKPVQAVGCAPCKVHVFGAKRLQERIASESDEANRYPVCGTVWFEPGAV
ncbi:hypothetical protein BU26DRAFT_519643 [Trematosphaeria pertusa]|uniref:Uncharacterized protein n=1 Tax=Trematosphaeria pertusa TaxID=390896 RepID=A0A6A6IBS4_9PLEO|nr:uncharacterized protein BU26DRAFT_519643 [Trematosphaeria pertusa]KAF2247831.1 hypothetical protein BU26DRAFT_519643 [Trematosphaeria pertusa]